MPSEAERYRSRYSPPRFNRSGPPKGAVPGTVEALEDFEKLPVVAPPPVDRGGYAGPTGTAIADFLTKTVPSFGGPNPTFDTSTGRFIPPGQVVPPSPLGNFGYPSSAELAAQGPNAAAARRAAVAAKLIEEKSRQDELDAVAEWLGGGGAARLGMGGTPLPFSTAAKAQSKKSRTVSCFNLLT